MGAFLELLIIAGTSMKEWQRYEFLATIDRLSVFCGTLFLALMVAFVIYVTYATVFVAREIAEYHKAMHQLEHFKLMENTQ